MTLQTRMPCEAARKKYVRQPLAEAIVRDGCESIAERSHKGAGQSTRGPGNDVRKVLAGGCGHTVAVPDSVRLADDIGRGLLQALQIDGRVAFAVVAEVLETSERTVERRYRSLLATGAVRVVGRVWPEALGERQWLIRAACVPDAAEGLALAVARRPETSWVQLTSAGAEILCMVRTPGGGGGPRPSSVLDRLPRSSRVTRIDGLSILAVFAGGPVSPISKSGPLSAPATQRIAAPAAPLSGDSPHDRVALSESDRALLRELARDGRARLRNLAAATGRSPATVRRRIDDLRRAGALYFDVDLDPEVLGLRAAAALWLSVHPAHLIAAGQALAAHPEVGFVAATTGATNLYASVQVRDDRALFAYLTGPVAVLPGVLSVQTTSVLRTIKQAGDR